MLLRPASEDGRASGGGLGESIRPAGRKWLEVVRTVVDECRDRGFLNWAAPPRVKADVDHPATLMPTLVDVAVEEPRTLIDWPVAVSAMSLPINVSSSRPSETS